MCFSAAASFTAGSLLCLGGIYTTRRSLKFAPKFIPLAAYPLGFGLQQLMEGGVWLNLQSDFIETGRIFALGFLFFSHCFWLFWVPFSIFWLEERPLQKQILLGLTILGGLFGVSLYLPLLLNDWVQVEVARQHITYDVKLIYSDWIPWTIGRSVYAAFILIPFLIAPKPSIHLLGILIFASMVATAFIYDAIAFISVWCFFAALISSYIIYLLREKTALEIP